MVPHIAWKQRLRVSKAFFFLSSFIKPQTRTKTLTLSIIHKIADILQAVFRDFILFEYQNERAMDIQIISLSFSLSFFFSLALVGFV